MADETQLVQLLTRKSPLESRPDIFRGEDGWIWTIKSLPANEAEFADVVDELKLFADEYLSVLRKEITEHLKQEGVSSESVRRIVAEQAALVAVFLRFELETYKLREELVRLKGQIDNHDLHRTQMHEQIKSATDPFDGWGIWDKHKPYRQGAVVTDDGSLWRAILANKGTRPGDGLHWKLIAKRGSPGKDLSGPLEELRRRVEKLEAR